MREEEGMRPTSTRVRDESCRRQLHESKDVPVMLANDLWPQSVGDMTHGQRNTGQPHPYTLRNADRTKGEGHGAASHDDHSALHGHPGLKLRWCISC